MAQVFLSRLFYEYKGGFTMTNFKFPRSRRFVPFSLLNNESNKSKELDEFNVIDEKK